MTYCMCPWASAAEHRSALTWDGPVGGWCVCVCVCMHMHTLVHSLLAASASKYVCSAKSLQSFLTL